MKNKFIVLAFILFGFSTQSRAQSNPNRAGKDSIQNLLNATPEQRAQMQNDRMKEKLALNDDQYKKVSALNLLYAQKMDPVIHSDDSRFSKYRKIKPLLKEKDEKLKTILTKDQYKQYESFKKEMMDKVRESQR